MKNLFYKIFFTLSVVASIISCQTDEESPFPEERRTPDEEIEYIKTLLSDAEEGWTAIVFPDKVSAGGYRITVKFNEDGTCEMVSDFIDRNAPYGTIPFDGTVKETKVHYGVKKVTNFELSFETYCALHKMYENNYITNYEFRIAQYNDDLLILSNGDTDFELRKATAADWNMTPYITNELKLIEYGNNSILFNYLHKGDDPQIQISLSRDQRAINLYYYDESGEVVETENGFYYTEEGIKLKKPVEVPGLGTISTIKFNDFEEGINKTKILNVTLDGDKLSQIYSSVFTMIPVDDGIEHFKKVYGISMATGGRFWSSRPRFEQGFRYGEGSTYFGLENNDYFSDFSIYLGYYNPKVNATYNMFSFVFGGGPETTFYDVYFTYETSGTDQIVFSLDTEKGNGGYSSYIDAYIRSQIEGMVNKMIQPEGFTLVSSPYVNPIDNSLSMFIVDNKDAGFMYMRTGDLHY